MERIEVGPGIPAHPQSHAHSSADGSGVLSTYARLAAANTFTVAPQTITIDNAANQGLRINLAAAQSARGIEVRDSDDVVAFQLAGAAGASDILISRYAQASQVGGRRAEGTSLLPTATALDSQIATFGARGYGAAFATQDKAQIAMVAAELWSPSVQGTYIDVTTTKIGGTARTAYWRFTDDGAFRFKEVASVAAPVSGFAELYASTVDSKLRYVDDAGVDRRIAGYEGSYDPGNTTIATGEFLAQPKKLILTGTEVLVGQGTAEIIVFDLPATSGSLILTGRGN